MVDAQGDAEGGYRRVQVLTGRRLDRQLDRRGLDLSRDPAAHDRLSPADRGQRELSIFLDEILER